MTDSHNLLYENDTMQSRRHSHKKIQTKMDFLCSVIEFDI